MSQELTDQRDVVFRFPDGHTWAYAGFERVWMGESPVGAEWADCEECNEVMDRIGEPPPSEIPFELCQIPAAPVSR